VQLKGKKGGGGEFLLWLCWTSSLKRKEKGHWERNYFVITNAKGEGKRKRD